MTASVPQDKQKEVTAEPEKDKQVQSRSAPREASVESEGDQHTAGTGKLQAQGEEHEDSQELQKENKVSVNPRLRSFSPCSTSSYWFGHWLESSSYRFSNTIRKQETTAEEEKEVIFCNSV